MPCEKFRNIRAFCEDKIKERAKKRKTYKNFVIQRKLYIFNFFHNIKREALVVQSLEVLFYFNYPVEFIGSFAPLNRRDLIVKHLRNSTDLAVVYDHLEACVVELADGRDNCGGA